MFSFSLCVKPCLPNKWKKSLFEWFIVCAHGVGLFQYESLERSLQGASFEESEEGQTLKLKRPNDYILKAGARSVAD